MADTRKAAPPHASWLAPPDAEIRRIRTMVEDQMMIKLGAKRETVEFHPLILTQRVERAKTSIELNYRRVKPPYQEKQPPNRNPWGSADLAIRQMSHYRQGPRNLSLPSLPHQKPVKRVFVPSEDEEFRKMRILRLLKRDELLAEWSDLQLQALALKRLNRLSLPDTKPLRQYSSASFDPSRSPSTEKIPSTEKKKTTRKKFLPLTHFPPTGKPESCWRAMARQVLWNAKAAQMRLPEELPRSEVRIYISCTEDLSEEREFLAEVAYPELKTFCEKKGLGCHIVDLRHGSNRLKNDRETFDIIEYQIAKCRKASIGPCFVSLVGREADDKELPGWLTKDDMLAIRCVMVKSQDEAAVRALDNLYRLDSNYQPPIYLLENSAFFVETKETEILQRVLLEILTQLRKKGKMAEEPGYYPWSSTVKEIHTGQLSCPEPKRQTICLMTRARTNDDPVITTSTTNTNDSLISLDSSSTPFEYTALTGNDSADRLRAAIVDFYSRMGNKKNLILFNSKERKTFVYLREVCTLFMSAVTHLIERQIAHLDFDVSCHLTHAADAVQHVAVARQTCTNFLGEKSELDGVLEHLRDPIKLKPVVIVGPEGSGKTATASFLATELLRTEPHRKVVFRLLGLTLKSSTVGHLMTTLYQQVAFLYDADARLPADVTVQGLLQAFRELLYHISDRTLQKGPLTLVLDGLDKVPDMTPKHLTFIMGSLLQGVTLVLTVLSSGPLYDTIMSGDELKLTKCPTFRQEHIGTYIKTFLSRRSRALTDDQNRAILGELCYECVPLVAKISAAMALRWPSHTLNDVLDISSDLESAFHRLVESCEKQLGYSFTRYSLSLLAASRYGLAESEMLHIISTDPELIDEINEEADNMSTLEGYPYQLQLSRLLSRMELFLYEVTTEGETVLKISHDILKKVLHKRFLSDSFLHHVHSRLAIFFQFTSRGSLLSSRDIVEGKHKNLSHYLWRMFRSVPYHISHSHSDKQHVWKRLKSEVFMKFAWIINEIYAGFFDDFIEDINYALETLGLQSDVMFFRQFLVDVRQTVIFNPVSLASLLAGQDMKALEELQNSVMEAHEWLKQVHRQALVPASYTAAKASQLQMNSAMATNAKCIVTSDTGEPLIVQYEFHLSLVDPKSGEETILVTLPVPIISAHLWGSAMLTTVTSSTSGELALDTYIIDRGRHFRSITLKNYPLTWIHIRFNGIALYASGCYIRKVQLEKGLETDLYMTKEDIADACLSEHKHAKLATLHVSPHASLCIFDLHQSSAQCNVFLHDAVITHLCKPLLMSKDSAHLLVVCQRELLLVDLALERVTHTLGFNNVPVNLVAFSRSHEHVFAVALTGRICCFKLKSGDSVMDATIHSKQKSRLMAETPLRERLAAFPAITTEKPKVHGIDESEHVTTVLTSEDDHFLLAGTTRGRVHVLHVPTGLEVCVINIGSCPLKQLTYFTNLSWFQNIVTVDAVGLVKLWNLKTLLASARTLIMDIITDKDLRSEEEAKLDLGFYFTHFQQRRNDRIFLNGPDITSFYVESPPSDLLHAVQDLDPALQNSQSWKCSGRLGDCDDVAALSTGSDLSEILVTATRHVDLARWSLLDGSLLSLQSCLACTGKEAVVESLSSVFYDQAVCVVLNNETDRKTVAIQYAEDQKKQPLIQTDVITAQISHSGSLMALLCMREEAGLILEYWDLISGQNVQSVILSEDTSFIPLIAATTFSSDLKALALLLSRGLAESTLYVWTLLLRLEPDEESKGKLRVVPDRPERVLSRSVTSVSSRKGSKDCAVKEVKLKVKPTAICFALDDAILLGMTSGLILWVVMETQSLIATLTAEGVEPVTDKLSSVTETWNPFSPAHSAAITKLTPSAPGQVITSTCGKTVCVWNLQEEKLLVQVSLGGEEFLQYVLSRDSRLLTYVTSDKVIGVWGVQEKKQLCAFRLQYAVTALAITPDNRRLAILEDNQLTSRVRVFDIKNIDDIKMNDENKRQQRTEMRENGESSVDEQQLQYEGVRVTDACESNQKGKNRTE